MSFKENAAKVKKLFQDHHPYWAEGHATALIEKVPDVNGRHYRRKRYQQGKSY